MKSASGSLPTFRPAVLVPELQKILLEDANKISDISPSIYIFKSGEQAEDREKALQAQWQFARVNYHLLFATVISRYCGTGFLQLCYSPELRNGKGGLYVKSRDPRTVGFDPTTDYEFDPSYLYWEDWMHPEEVRRLWPHTSKNVRPTNQSVQGASIFQSGSGYGFQMPPGPMSGMPGMPTSAPNIGRSLNDTRWRVRHFFCKDYTRELVEARDVPDGSLVDPEFKWRYPNGRYLAECNGVILSDGQNPWPHRPDIPAPFFPIIPVWALPPLYGPWGVPVTRFSLSLQSLAERMLTQIFENIVRTNNCIWAIDKGSGIDVEAFAGIPGEVVEINPNSKPPVPLNPPQLTQQGFQFPEVLLEKQRLLLGVTEAKQGKPGAGNVSTGLFDASILQSSGLLQLAGRLQYFTVSQLANLMFYTMARYIDRFSLPLRGEKGTEVVTWQGILDPHDFDLMLDESSIQPLSDVMFRRLVPDLMKAGVLNTERALQVLGVPHAEQIATEHRQNLELQALSRTRGGKGK